ncbi:MAG: HAMP domain-containing histidine kinase [Lachnospiraceae bacterium]|nr:HAMP domain-containing histidine kinase [Lachnospiraceae bacterium]
MKLWQKIFLLTLTVTFLVLGSAVFVTVSSQARSIRTAEEEQAKRELTVFSRNLTSSMTYHEIDFSDVSFRSMLIWYCSTYDSLLKDDTHWYGLLKGNDTLYSRSTFEITDFFPDPDVNTEMTGEDDGCFVKRTAEEQGPLLILLTRLSLPLKNDYRVFLIKNISGTENRIQMLHITAVSVLGFSLLLSAIFLFLIIRKALKPVASLTAAANHIAEGHYHLRTACHSKDEIGELSEAFDAMASSIEDKIRSLDEEIDRRTFLTGALAHEIRTPMTAIAGYAELLISLPMTQEQILESAVKIRDAEKRAEGLSEKIIEFISMPESSVLSYAPIDPEKIIKSLQELFPERVLYETDGQDLYGDELLLTSLIGNLVQNGLRASMEDQTVSVSLTREGSFSLIRVSDNGIGIPREHLDRVLEPFYRVDKARSRKMGGAGLGLAISSEIISRHKGSMDIRSEEDKGTTVTVKLPLSREEIS